MFYTLFFAELKISYIVISWFYSVWAQFGENEGLCRTPTSLNSTVSAATMSCKSGIQVNLCAPRTVHNIRNKRVSHCHNPSVCCRLLSNVKNRGLLPFVASRCVSSMINNLSWSSKCINYVPVSHIDNWHSSISV